MVAATTYMYMKQIQAMQHVYAGMQHSSYSRKPNWTELNQTKKASND